MKKTIILAGLALVLAGCSSNKTVITSKVTDGSNIVATTESGIEISKQTIYESLLSTYGADKVVDKALISIANKEITDTDKINAKVEETLTSYQSMLGGEEGLLSYIQSSGYSTIDDYKKSVLEPNVKKNLLIEKYVEDNFTTLSETYGYSYIQYFTMSTESEALSTINSIDKGEKTFEDAATESTGSVPDKKLCYTKASSSSIDSNISSIATQFTTAGMYSVPVALSDGTYAVIKVVDTDREANKEAIISSLTSISDVNSEANVYYLNANDFEVYEEGIVNDIKMINENYIK